MVETPTNPSGSESSGLAPNIASLLCYICMPITSIIFLLLEKENKDVQFHAWQGTTFGIGSYVLLIALSILSWFLGLIAQFLAAIISFAIMPIVGIALFILWVVCLVKAYQGERWRIPYVGDFAAKKAGLET